MSQPLTIDQLKEVRLLSCFQDAELKQMLSKGKEINFEPHANVVIEGENTGALYILIEGLMAVTKANSMGGGVYDLGQLKQGSFFGEMSLIDDSPRSASVRCLESSRCWMIEKIPFHEFLAGSSDRKLRFYENAIKILIRRLRETDENYVLSQYQLWKAALMKHKEAA